MTQKKLNPVKNKMFGNVEIKRKTRTNSSIKKEIFISVINNLEEALERQEKLFSELRLDYSTYNELYYKIIEDLKLHMKRPPLPPAGPPPGPPPGPSVTTRSKPPAGPGGNTTAGGKAIFKKGTELIKKSKNLFYPF